MVMGDHQSNCQNLLISRIIGQNQRIHCCWGPFICSLNFFAGWHLRALVFFCLAAWLVGVGPCFVLWFPCLDSLSKYVFFSFEVLINTISSYQKKKIKEFIIGKEKERDYKEEQIHYRNHEPKS